MIKKRRGFYACTRSVYLSGRNRTATTISLSFIPVFLRRWRTTATGKHTRDYYLIHWVTRGRGTYQTETAKYNLKEGDGFLILPGQTIVHTADKEEPWDLCWVAFFGRKAEEILKEAGLDREHLIFHYDKDTFLEDCIQNIYKESQTGKNVLYITGQFYLFMARLAEENTKERFLSTESSQFSRFEEAMNLPPAKYPQARFPWPSWPTACAWTPPRFIGSSRSTQAGRLSR